MTEIEKLIQELMERGGDIHRDDNGGSDTALFLRAASALTKLTAPVTEGEVEMFLALRDSKVIPALEHFLKGRSQ